jgi:hypothetical protein
VQAERAALRSQRACVGGVSRWDPDRREQSEASHETVRRWANAFFKRSSMPRARCWGLLVQAKREVLCGSLCSRHTAASEPLI